MRESDIQNSILVALSESGAYALRINSGTFWGGEIVAHDGRRLMLEHPTRINGAPAGTSDILGCSTVTITPDMVGQTVAIMFAVEVKRPGEPVPKHQDRYLALMRARGARAGVARSAEDAVKIARGER